ncbi:hypothetical protein [Methylorubrum thiocyanatum]|uniref:Uncharacterized protein n=1 Tax=Methylorubrum thiocyanatum TaxID=47958 RepID=A0AA40S4T3_9HYPH|nr:hypothetical protein [Methylorubrum thiocyanatum]MBA8914606.1 hypothetical protein [Methylorubrum thiocyanatum]GJE81981.1 hypothetical protein CJNNKLLH_3338 [Methylorubrum thiocyanatum]
MPPIIPFEFDPDSSNYETDHLTYDAVQNGQYVSWPPGHVRLFVPPHEYYPTPSELEQANPTYFQMFGAKGFMAGSYAEILIGQVPTFISLKMGNMEVSFGQASPLAAYVFEYVHRAKYFGAWDTIHTARMLGVTAENVEAAFLNASIQYHERTGTLPSPYAMDDEFLWAEEPDAPEPVSLSLGPIVKDLDPLRFFHFGIAQSNNAAACIYFYRTLEYFSFLMNQNKLTKLRHDGTISEADFAKRVLDVVFRDEKGPLLQLVNMITDASILQKSIDDNLIHTKTPGALGEAIYTFRNSIVHGKFSYGYTLQSGSVFDDDAQLPKWRYLLQTLARKAIAAFGSTLI